MAADGTAAVLAWSGRVALLLLASQRASCQTTGGPVNAAIMKMRVFEPAVHSQLPSSMVLAEFTAASECACQQACLARHDCLSVSITKEAVDPENSVIKLASNIDDDGDRTPSEQITSSPITCRLGRRRGHAELNLPSISSVFWERMGRSHLGDFCSHFSECVTAGAVCHDNTCVCAAGLRADGSCHCLERAAGEPCWFQTCDQVRSAGVQDSGVCLLRHLTEDDGHREFWARCEMAEDGHGWTVIQARDLAIQNGGNFNRSWNEYLRTFGSVSDNHWLGLRNIRKIIQLGGGEQALRIALQDESGAWDYAVYDTFRLAPEEQGFTLTVDGYQSSLGGLGAAMSATHYECKFSTYDKDQDSTEKNCALLLGGGWWYLRCRGVSLNGTPNESRLYRPRAMYWPDWGEKKIVKSLMMIRTAKD
ncbi:fibrinogen alpha chain-like [Amphibalanus amphitrite]|uniref:fibrinogen alpha chain-like n=1 Tax=Amphibalanus amphitrite TaxID=1232801 RepID=UPI001C90F35B|nr:fibrinogen alpha chain-like [Amphibalanus amphitrite]